MKSKDALDLITRLKDIFDVVRLVDVNTMEVCNIENNLRISKEEYKCYRVWNKNQRCTNCISAKACNFKSRIEKFEFIDGEVYHVISKYVVIDDNEYALELVTKSNDDMLFEAFGKGDFVKYITEINAKIYLDVLTGLKNRRYYIEQKARLDMSSAVALIDIDNFKVINDTYGHNFGDSVLRKISSIITQNLSLEDTIIRYGGDELYLFFETIDESVFAQKLEDIRKSVKINIEKEFNVFVSISIGGYYKGKKVIDCFDIVDKNLYIAKRKRDCVVI